jgi:hypothetical protein
VTTPTSINRPEASSLLLIYDTIAEELDKQFAQIDALNTRAYLASLVILSPYLV